MLERRIVKRNRVGPEQNVSARIVVMCMAAQGYSDAIEIHHFRYSADSRFSALFRRLDVSPRSPQGHADQYDTFNGAAFLPGKVVNTDQPFDPQPCEGFEQNAGNGTDTNVA